MPSSKAQFEAAIINICNKISITPFHRAFVASLCMPLYKNDLPIVPVDVGFMLAEMILFKQMSDLTVVTENEDYKVYRINSEFDLRVEEEQRKTFSIIEIRSELTVTFLVCNDGTVKVVAGDFRHGENVREVLSMHTPENPILLRDRVALWPNNETRVCYTHIDDFAEVEINGMPVSGEETIALGDEDDARFKLLRGPIHCPDIIHDWQDRHPYLQTEYGGRNIFISINIIDRDGSRTTDIRVGCGKSSPVKLDSSFEYWHAVKELAECILAAV